ncbi:GFA family protein [Phaeobacter sp. CAU 1743]|uniref:GFA family protein n=1 Tax=Phaeobacter sp. CAU 1743 TaxID=3140367 RepID=UPI00325B2206
MTTGLTGSCLCGQVAYDTGSEPLWITICHCRFCQRATGSDRMIQPVFERRGFNFGAVRPKVYTQPSDGSGKDINVHFCPDCGTKLALTFERWPDKIGLYIGTLDNPHAVKIGPDNCKHIFVSEAQPGTLLPPEVKVFDRHVAESDGTPIEPTIYSKPITT